MVVNHRTLSWYVVLQMYFSIFPIETTLKKRTLPGIIMKDGRQQLQI